MTESQIDCVIPQLQMNPVFGWLPCNSVRGWHSLRLSVFHVLFVRLKIGKFFDPPQCGAVEVIS